MKKVEKTIELASRKLTLSTKNVAELATASVMARYGDTVVLATVVSQPMKDDPGYFPLMVEYQERLYAGGRIKGSRWVKREGRPSDDEILTARLIDRSIRPLFPKEYKKEVQVVVIVLSVDLENSPEFVAGIAVSAALTASKIPFNGPVAIVRVGMEGEEYVLNPLISQKDSSVLDLTVSSTKDSVVMIEAGSKEIPDEKMIEAINYAAGEGKKINTFIEEFVAEVGEKKEALDKTEIPSSLVSSIKKQAKDKIEEITKNMAKSEGGNNQDFNELVNAVSEKVDDNEKAFVYEILDKLKKEYVRDQIMSGKRLDGRKMDEVRDLSCEVSVLPRTHGSGVFKRGQTHVLSIATLGTSSLEQLIESAEGEETKRYMHFYSMPPYSVGETGRIGFPSRREIGHGALAEKALLPVIPSKDEFPYTISVVSEVLSSNGSTSMASTCGSTLALMDAGVPIKSPVAGIAMGLVAESKKDYKILTDIMGMEDFNGDMDFKIAGTKDGITALQLDVKTLLLDVDMLKEALTQAKKARETVLKSMLSAISQIKETLSPFAPKIKVVKVPQDKIGEIIGPGGKTIRSIIAQTGADVEVDDEGRVSISATDQRAVEAAAEKVELLIKEAVAGEIYEGTVKRVESFGAFVEIFPGREGMVHVSDMSMDFVKDASDIVKIGDKVSVRVKEIDNLGRVNLSMLLDGDKPKRNGFESKQRNGDRRKYSQNEGKQRESSGPHFPASRFMSSIDQKKKKY